MTLSLIVHPGQWQLRRSCPRVSRYQYLL